MLTSNRSAFAVVLALAVVWPLAGCKSKPGESALVATIEVEAPLTPTCLALEVSANGTVHDTQTLVFDASKRSYKVGIKQLGLPADVSLRAFASRSAHGCDDPRVVLSASPAVAAKFPTGGVGQASLTITASPPHDLDGDGDGYVAATQGGDDCDDANALAHPAPAQDCNQPFDSDCNGQAGCLDTACASTPACQSGGAQLAFLNAPVATGPDTCAGPLTVSLRTAAGSPVNAAADLPVGFSSAPSGLSFFSDAACATASPSVTIATGSNTGALYFKGSTKGSYVVTASSGALTPATQTETITDAPVVSLAFTSPPRTVIAGACSAEIDLTTLDGSNNPTTLATAMQVALTSSQSGVGFFSDAACNTPLAGNLLPFAAGASSAKLYVVATQALATNLTASLSGVPPASQALTVQPAAADHLAFVTQPQGVASGACSGVVVLEARDPFDNPSPPASGVTAALTETGVSGFTFYSDTACATPLSGGTVSFNASAQAYFHFVGTSPGTATITATPSSGALTAATQDEVVGVGPPAVLAFTSAPQSAPSGQCSAQPVVVQVRDSTGNPVTVTGSAVTVNLSAMPAASFTLWADAGCTQAITSSTQVMVGSSSVSFWFKGTQVGPVTVTASATNLTSDMQTESIIAGPPAQLVFNNGAQSSPAGTCTQFTLAVRDGQGNATTVTADTPITLSANPMTVAFSAAPGCSPSGTSVTMTAGTGSVSFYGSGTMVGTPMLTAAAPFGTAHQTFTITAGAPTGLTLTTPARLGVVSGVCSPDVTVQLHDGFGNVTNAPSATDLNLASTATGTFGFHGVTACGGGNVTVATVPQGSSSVTFSFLGTKAESFQLTVSATGLGSQNQPASIVAAGASQLVFSTPSRFGVSATACSPVLTLERLDAAGNPAVGGALAVTLSAGSGNASFFTDNACGTLATTSVSIPSGQSTADFYFQDATAETFTVTASSGSLTPAAQLQSVTAGGVSKLVITTAPQSVAAGACSGAVTVQRQDMQGNPASPATVDTVSLAWAGMGAMQFFTDNLCGTSPVTTADIAASTSSVNVYFKSSRAELAALTVSSGVLSPDSQNETVTAGSASKLAFTTAPMSVDAAACSSAPVTVQSQDGFGNPSNVTADTMVGLAASGAGAPGTFSTGSTCAAPVTAVNLANGTNTVSFYFTGSNPGTLTLTASASGLGMASQDETINPRPPTQLALAPATTPAEAGACVAVTVTREDSTGTPTAPASATAVTLSVLPATGLNLYSDSGCTSTATGVTIASGQSTATYYVKGITGGTGSTGATYSLGATASGLTSASANIVVLQMVRRGTCTVLHNQNSATCAVAPAIPGNDISRTFLVYQGADVWLEQDRDDIECHLASTTGGVNVLCARQGNPGGASADVVMTWQTVSSAKTAANGGISVQHLSGSYTNNSTGLPIDTTLNPPVDLGQSFVLSGTSQNGTNNYGAGFLTAQLFDSTTARLNQTSTNGKAVNSGTWSMDVVTFAGASVTRGVLTPNATGGSWNASATSPDLTRTALFFTARTDDTGGTDQAICKRRFRGVVANASTLTFTRQDTSGGTNCTNSNLLELPWEEVVFPTGTLVQAVDVTVNGNTFTGQASLATPVDTTRTVLFMPGNGPGGQAAGETNYAGNDTLAYALGTPTFTGNNTVVVTRAVRGAGNNSRYSVFAVQLTP